LKVLSFGQYAYNQRVKSTSIGAYSFP
jgi:hypothetical protein